MSIQAAELRKKGIVELTIAMVLSGTIGVFVFESGAQPFTVAFWRCVFGAGALGLYCWIRGFFSDTGFTRKTFLLALLGGVFIVYNWAFLFSAYAKTSISLATVVYHTQPFYVVLLGALVFKEKLTAAKLGWVGVAFAGVVLVTDITSVTVSGSYLLGIGQALLAALLYAFATIIAKQLKGIRPHLIALVQVTAGIFLLLPFVDFSGTASIGNGWAWLVGIGVIHTCVMYVLMYSSYQKLPTSLIAVLSFVYPVVAIIVDMSVYGTRIHPLQIVGILLICGASLANSLGTSQRAGRLLNAGKSA
ncbi:DMT family transporter [Lentzea aerocolonigenes]|uniref:DMT family transporter n=1 Tax=Lentzea aerocolonigenes TaxID=68170 RepID=UPI0005ECA630|nr:DMT family transporter [Lentzea aerocolonigenes]